MAGFTINTHVSFFSIAVLFLRVVPSSSSTDPIITTQDVQLIQRVCSYASGYTSLCISSLSSRSESRTADITGLMSISLDNAYKNGVTDSVNLGNYGFLTKDPVVRGVMSDCRNKYVSSAQTILGAKSAAEAKNRDLALRRISTAITGVQQCGDVLKKLQGRPAPHYDVKENDKELGLINIANLMITLALK